MLSNISFAFILYVFMSHSFLVTGGFEVDTEPEVVLPEGHSRCASVQSEPQCGCGSSFLEQRINTFDRRNPRRYELVERETSQIGNGV